jgi:hypothetical protein
MSDYYPVGVTPKDFNEDKSTYEITIDDVLDDQYALVDGFEFDTHATVTLRRKGDEITVHEFEMRSVHVIVHGDGSTETFMLDKETFRKSWRRKLELAIEAMAIEKARKSFKWEKLDE